MTMVMTITDTPTKAKLLVVASVLSALAFFACGGDAVVSSEDSQPSAVPVEPASPIPPVTIEVTVVVTATPTIVPESTATSTPSVIPATSIPTATASSTPVAASV